MPNLKNKKVLVTIIVFLMIVAIFIFRQSGTNRWKHATPGEDGVNPFYTTVPDNAVTLFALRSSIATGTVITEDKINIVFWPKSQIPFGAASDKASLIGEIASGPIIEGIPILQRNIRNP